MQKIFSSITSCVFFLLLATTSYSQRDSALHKQKLSAQRQNWEQRGDSAIASREVVRMKHLFILTPEQEQTLFQAGIQMNQRRRQVVKVYEKTDVLSTEMKKVKNSTDSLYKSIIGEAHFTAYKDAMHARLLPRKQMTGTDSLNHKTLQP